MSLHVFQYPDQTTHTEVEVMWTQVHQAVHHLPLEMRGVIFPPLGVPNHSQCIFKWLHVNHCTVIFIHVWCIKYNVMHWQFTIFLVSMHTIYFVTSRSYIHPGHNATTSQFKSCANINILCKGWRYSACMSHMTMLIWIVNYGLTIHHLNQAGWFAISFSWQHPQSCPVYGPNNRTLGHPSYPVMIGWMENGSV